MGPARSTDAGESAGSVPRRDGGIAVASAARRITRDVTTAFTAMVVSTALLIPRGTPAPTPAATAGAATMVITAATAAMLTMAVMAATAAMLTMAAMTAMAGETASGNNCITDMSSPAKERVKK